MGLVGINIISVQGMIGRSGIQVLVGTGDARYSHVCLRAIGKPVPCTGVRASGCGIDKLLVGVGMNGNSPTWLHTMIPGATRSTVRRSIRRAGSLRVRCCVDDFDAVSSASEA